MANKTWYIHDGKPVRLTTNEAANLKCFPASVKEIREGMAAEKQSRINLAERFKAKR